MAAKMLRSVCFCVVPCLLGARVALAATPAQVRNFLGGMTGKLVYVDPNDSNKAYRLDLGSMTTAKISDDTNVRSPLISPDGQWIVYERSSRSYIRKIDGTGSAIQLPASPAEAPHWYDDGSTTYIIHCSDAEDINSGGYTQRQALDGSMNPVGTAEMFYSTRAADAGMSPDGRWLAETYPYSFLVDLANGNREYGWSWFVYTADDPVNPSEIGKRQQTCNGSISGDVGRNWRYLTLRIPHERFTIWRFDTANSRWAEDRTLDVSITQATPPYQEWQHTEWSNHPDFIAMTAGYLVVGPYDIHLMNTATEGLLKLLDADTDFPHLWVEATSPYLLLQPGDLTFAALVGGSDPADRTVYASNWGAGSMGQPSVGTIQYDTGSGWLTANAAGSNVTVSVDASGLTTAGAYTATVPLSASSATNSARSLPVKLVMLDPADDADGDGVSNGDEIAAGTDPLDRYHVPSSDGGDNGCTASAGSGLLAAWLALAGLAAARSARAR